MTKVVTTADCIQVQPINQILRVDGLPVCQVIANESDGRLWLRFMDTDRYRNQARGTRYVEIPFEVFIKAIKEKCS